MPTPSQPLTQTRTRELWLHAVWMHGDRKAQLVGQMCCHDRIVGDLLRLPEKQRLAILREFFGNYPVNGRKIADLLNRLGATELFVPTKPVSAVIAPVLDWGRQVGVEVHDVERIRWTDIAITDNRWLALSTQLRLSLSAQASGNTYLQVLGDVLNQAISVRKAGTDRRTRQAMLEVKAIAQRTLWDLALDESSGWGSLLKVFFMGYWPRGVTENGTFLVSHRPVM